MLSSITKKGEIESASRPLMGFVELNDNLIKGLTRSSKLSWAEFIRISICVLAHVSWNQIKGKMRKNCCWKWSCNNNDGFYYGLTKRDKCTIKGMIAKLWQAYIKDQKKQVSEHWSWWFLIMACQVEEILCLRELIVHV